MSCVNSQSGVVEPKTYTMLGSAWSPKFTLENILLGLRAEMSSSANKRLAQPPEGTTF
eukprot:gene2673-3089_t